MSSVLDFSACSLGAYPVQMDNQSQYSTCDGQKRLVDGKNYWRVRQAGNIGGRLRSERSDPKTALGRLHHAQC